jgi:hypothetical protein
MCASVVELGGIHLVGSIHDANVSVMLPFVIVTLGFECFLCVCDPWGLGAGA